MKFSFPSFMQWRSGVIAALSRFPWNILCAATGAASMIVLVHTEHNEWLDDQSARLAMAAAVGMPLFFSLRMLRERTAAVARWPIEVVGVPILALWILMQPARPSDGPGIIWIRWLLLLAALHFVAAVSAYLGRSESSGFWQFNRRLFLRFCLATLYTGVLTAGLELALLSADKLFQLKLDKEYADLFFLMIGLFHPAFFLAGVPRDFTALDADTEYPRGLKAFTQFALAPLVAVYTAILYAYAIKIIIVHSWPHGWVALPVLLLSGIGILAFLLLYPLQRQPDEKWAGWFTTNFPRALAPLSILLLLSVHVRVRDYGVTEGRYIGIVAAVWVLAWTIIFVPRRNAGIRWIPTSLAIIALLSAFGPLSAGAISKTSQLHRLERMLQVHKLWQGNHAQPSSQTIEISKDQETDLRETLRYLIGTHGGKTIQTIFEPSVIKSNWFVWEKLTSWEGARDIIDALRITSHEDFGTSIIVRRKPNSVVAIDGFTRMSPVHMYIGRYSEWYPIKCGDIRIGLSYGALKLETPQDSGPQDVPLGNLANILEEMRRESARSKELTNEQMTVDFRRGTRVFRIVFDSITFDHGAEGLRLTSSDLYLLEK